MTQDLVIHHFNAADEREKRGFADLVSRLVIEKLFPYLSSGTNVKRAESELREQIASSSASLLPDSVSQDAQPIGSRKCFLIGLCKNGRFAMKIKED